MIPIEMLMVEDGLVNLEAIAQAAVTDGVDGGWHSDEELVLLDDKRSAGTVFDAPAFSALDDTQRQGALGAAVRMLFARGELVNQEGSNAPRFAGSAVPIGEVLSGSTRQTTVEVQTASGPGRYLVARQLGEVRMVEEIYGNGLHRFLFCGGDVELQVLTDVVIGGSVVADHEPTLVASGPPESDAVRAALRGVEDNPDRVALVTAVATDQGTVGEAATGVVSVTAWSKGGATTIGNCEMLCVSHNRMKGNK